MCREKQRPRFCYFGAAREAAVDPRLPLTHRIAGTLLAITGSSVEPDLAATGSLSGVLCTRYSSWQIRTMLAALDLLNLL